MDDQDKEGQPFQESPWVTVGLFVLGALIIGSALGEDFDTIAEKVEAYFKKTEPTWKALAQIDWPAAMQRLEALPEKSKDAMQLALAEGWFFGWHDSLQGVMELVESFETPGKSVDNIMMTYYRTNLQPFTDQLVRQYPDRAAAIKAAIDAHTSIPDGGFFLSVPVFIAQADGLLAEITGIESPRTTEAIEKFRGKYIGNPEKLDLLNQFWELRDSDFMKSAKAREYAAQASGKTFTALNRHQVMHGERSDYGTEINSLKAFSFLVFAGLHVPEVLRP